MFVFLNLAAAVDTDDHRFLLQILSNPLETQCCAIYSCPQTFCLCCGDTLRCYYQKHLCLVVSRAISRKDLQPSGQSAWCFNVKMTSTSGCLRTLCNFNILFSENLLLRYFSLFFFNSATTALCKPDFLLHKHK